MNVQIKHLRAFVEVARCGVFVRAAEVLGISQPSLTVTINQFEEQLGFRLFDRTTRRVWLTQKGTAFLQTAESLLEQFDAAIANLQTSGRNRKGRVSIAAVPSAAVYLLPNAIKEYSERHPAVTVYIADANSNAIHQMVMRQEVDFGIGGFEDVPTELEALPLTQDKLGVVCRADHPLAKSKAALPWSALRGLPFLGLNPDTGVYPLIARVDVLPESVRNPQYRVSNMAALEGLLRSGLGITVLPELAMPRQHPKLAFRRLINPALVRTIGLLRRRDKSLSPAAESLRRTICEMYKLPNGAKTSDR